MGGNALTVPTVRLDSTDYFTLVDNVMATLEQFSMRKSVIPAYKHKPDFGDMDILFASDGTYNPLEVAKVLNATEGVANGDVMSIGVTVLPDVSKRVGNTFQIDLIKVPEESFDFALRYFAFNDLGNLLGRVAHKAGFKLGHFGLLYPLRDPENSDHVLGEVVITRDWGQALELLGYDSETYEKGFPEGFATLTDIFNFVVSSPYVNKEIYLLDNRNAKARVRDSKRKTYMQFLEWLDDTPIKVAFDWSNKAGMREHFLNQAFVTFPEFKKSYDALLESHKHTKAINAKFNGKLVMELTGLKGIELGQFMKHLRNVIDVDTFVLSASDEAIMHFINLEFDKFKY